MKQHDLPSPVITPTNHSRVGGIKTEPLQSRRLQRAGAEKHLSTDTDSSEGLRERDAAVRTRASLARTSTWWHTRADVDMNDLSQVQWGQPMWTSSQGGVLEWLNCSLHMYSLRAPSIPQREIIYLSVYWIIERNVKKRETWLTEIC